MATKLTAQQLGILQGMVTQGFSDVEIARAIQVTPSAVRAAIKDNGIDRPSNTAKKQSKKAPKPNDPDTKTQYKQSNTRRSQSTNTVMEDLARTELEKNFGVLGRYLGRKYFPDARKDPTYTLLNRQQKVTADATERLTRTVQQQMTEIGTGVERLSHAMTHGTAQLTREITRVSDRITSSMSGVLAALVRFESSYSQTLRASKANTRSEIPVGQESATGDKGSESRGLSLLTTVLVSAATSLATSVLKDVAQAILGTKNDAEKINQPSGDVSALENKVEVKNLTFKADTLTFKAPVVRFRGQQIGGTGRGGGGGGEGGGRATGGANFPGGGRQELGARIGSDTSGRDTSGGRTGGGGGGGGGGGSGRPGELPDTGPDQARPTGNPNDPFGKMTPKMGQAPSGGEPAANYAHSDPEIAKAPLKTYRTNQGQKFQLNTAVGERAMGILNELEARGYPVKSAGGYAHRSKAKGGGLSEHAYGAFDINTDVHSMSNPRTNLPPNTERLAWLYGYVWGGRFSRGYVDPMHFEPMSPENWKKRLGQLVKEGFISQAEADARIKGINEGKPVTAPPGYLKDGPVKPPDDSAKTGPDGQKAGPPGSQADAVKQGETDITHTGIASWYHPGDGGTPGTQTASGQPYSHDEFAAAIQQSLRKEYFGTGYGKNYQPAYVRVDYNGKSAIVKINDVGPLDGSPTRLGKRIIDLNSRVAKYFGISGLGKGVKITKLRGKDWTPGPIDPNTNTSPQEAKGAQPTPHDTSTSPNATPGPAATPQSGQPAPDKDEPEPTKETGRVRTDPDAFKIPEQPRKSDFAPGDPLHSRMEGQESDIARAVRKRKEEREQAELDRQKAEKDRIFNRPKSELQKQIEDSVAKGIEKHTDEKEKKDFDDKEKTRQFSPINPKDPGSAARSFFSDPKNKLQVEPDTHSKIDTGIDTIEDAVPSSIKSDSKSGNDRKKKESESHSDVEDKNVKQSKLESAPRHDPYVHGDKQPGVGKPSGSSTGETMIA